MGERERERERASGRYHNSAYKPPPSLAAQVLPNARERERERERLRLGRGETEWLHYPTLTTFTPQQLTIYVSIYLYVHILYVHVPYYTALPSN
jgi:hypothetical protein